MLYDLYLVYPILSGLYIYILLTFNTIWLIYTIWIYIANCKPVGTILLLYKPLQQWADLLLPQFYKGIHKAGPAGIVICWLILRADSLMFLLLILYHLVMTNIANWNITMINR